jgi:hypothetical protein
LDVASSELVFPNSERSSTEGVVLIGGTQWLAMAVRSSVPWTKREVTLEFRGHEILVRPESEKPAASLAIKFDTPGQTRDAALSVGRQFLSALAWADGSGIEELFIASGSKPPLLGKSFHRGIVTTDFRPDYLPAPADPRALLALAFYREALTVNSVPYGFLGFFKIINIGYKDGKAQIDWIAKSLGLLQSQDAKARIQFLQRAGKDVADYLYGSGRCAVAHANAQPLVDPEDPEDLERLGLDLPVIRALAEYFIEYELKVQSRRTVLQEHLYELEGFRAVVGERLVARIKGGEILDVAALPNFPSLDLRLRDATSLETLPTFQVVQVIPLDGILQLECASADGHVCVRLGLNFREERLMFDVYGGVFVSADTSNASLRTRVTYLRFLRKYLCNGTLQVWDHQREQLLGRRNPFLPENIDIGRTCLTIDAECESLEQQIRVQLDGPATS